MTKSEYRRLGLILGSRDPLAGVIAWWKEQAPKRKPISQRKIEKKAKRLSGNGEWDAIKAVVLERAAGRCEHVSQLAFRCLDAARDVDHWLNGNGRKRQKQSVETCWALCRQHHDSRQHYRPSVEHWNALFAQHCALHGYHFEPHIEHAPLPSRAAPRSGLKPSKIIARSTP